MEYIERRLRRDTEIRCEQIFRTVEAERILFSCDYRVQMLVVHHQVQRSIIILGDAEVGHYVVLLRLLDNHAVIAVQAQKIPGTWSDDRMYHSAVRFVVRIQPSQDAVVVAHASPALHDVAVPGSLQTLDQLLAATVWFGQVLQ